MLFDPLDVGNNESEDAWIRRCTAWTTSPARDANLNVLNQKWTSFKSFYELSFLKIVDETYRCRLHRAIQHRYWSHEWDLDESHHNRQLRKPEDWLAEGSSLEVHSSHCFPSPAAILASRSQIHFQRVAISLESY